MTKRRVFLKQTTTAAMAIALRPALPLLADQDIMTVTGRIRNSKMGRALIHEHILVDFVGAKDYNLDRWDKAEVTEKVLPYLLEVKELGCETLVDCTPAYLGRDVNLLQDLSRQSGLQILTNTGYYGARDNQHLPKSAFSDSAESIAQVWIDEYIKGIDGTDIKPGFVKIGVNPGSLSPLHQKLVRAAALTHKETGLTIASHTGEATPAFEEMEILKSEGVDLSAFVWVHAQNERNTNRHIEAAARGAWVSLDGVHKDKLDWYLEILSHLKLAGLLNKVLLSQDAGWYRPGESDGGDFRGYTDLFTHLVPAMNKRAFTKKEIRIILEKNPAEAFAIIKRLKG